MNRKIDCSSCIPLWNRFHVIPTCRRGSLNRNKLIKHINKGEFKKKLFKHATLWWLDKSLVLHCSLAFQNVLAAAPARRRIGDREESESSCSTIVSPLASLALALARSADTAGLRECAQGIPLLCIMIPHPKKILTFLNAACDGVNSILLGKRMPG